MSDEFKPPKEESDDETTIEKAEKHISKESRRKEVKTLQDEMNIPIEEILAQYKRNAAAADGSDEEDEESEEYTGSASDEDNEESSGSKSESESDEGEKEAEGKEGCCKSKKEAEPPKKRCKKE